MPTCDQCSQQKEKVFVCSRCKAARYCSSDCQRSAWKAHKKTCKPPLPYGPDTETVTGVLLGRGCTAQNVRIPKPPFQISDVRHLFTEHNASQDSDFITMPMPFGLRLFNCEMHIIFDRSRLAGRDPSTTVNDNNTWATRGAAALSTGFGPPVRGQALVFDPNGASYNCGDFMSYDNVIYNLVMDMYSDNWTARTPTEDELDSLSTRCQRFYRDDRPNYTDDGTCKAYAAGFN